MNNFGTGNSEDSQPPGCPQGEGPGRRGLRQPCTTFKPWHDKTTGRTGLKMTAGQCLHYYFYFNDAQLGLCHLRVQSWAPFRLQLCLNGHNWLARWMDQKHMTYKMEDNAFVQIDNWAAAQEMASALDPARLHTAFERLRREVIPFTVGNEHFRSGVYWSVMQIERSHDIIFKNQAALEPLCATISRQAMLAVKAPEVARFLGKPLPRENSDTPQGSDYHTRIEGTRIKHFMGPASLKMYDKRGRVLRVEPSAGGKARDRLRGTSSPPGRGSREAATESMHLQ